jgi:DNA mismatch repair protein MutL
MARSIPPIHVLDDLTISRIAAGEVVERPASVVKELVENSLDAGASDIRIEITAGGRRLIRVSDNGQGIPSDQVELACARHATSKLDRADDLSHVATLGFRGEALASIAAVSHLTLQSRPADATAGVRLRIDNGRRLSLAAAGSPPGTVVTVENLFNALPARLKFLRNETTEAGHIHDVVTRYAMAYPHRRFLLVRDGRTVFQSPGTGDLADTLIAVFGIEVAREMIEVGASAGGEAAIRVGGFVSPPHVHRATRRAITLFVNGRWVHDTSLTHAVVQAYHTLLPTGRSPLAILMITLPPAEVDVNVHPAKTEVRFHDARAVFSAVERATRTTVVGGAPVAPAGRSTGGTGATPWPDLWPGTRPRHRGAAEPAPADGAGPSRQASFLDEGGAQLPVLRVLGQIGQLYIVAEGPDGLYLIDQHAAHERVIYERFMSRQAPGGGQPLLVPETVPLSALHVGLVEEHGEAFAALGFDIAPFGPDAVLVRSLPEGQFGADVGAAVRAILDATAEGGTPLQDSFEARLTRAVCKQASIKAGQTLSLEEMKALIRDLEATHSPRTCPHGRPTMIRMAADRLAREFGR